MSVLDEIVKAYDIRGTVPDQLDAEVARALGVAFARTRPRPHQVLVARDMRPSGPELVAAFTDGVLDRASTSSTSGWRPPTCSTSPPAAAACPAAMFTASHNPAEYNGIEVLPRRRPAVDLAEIKAADQAVLDGHGPAPAPAPAGGTEENLLADFADHVVSFVDVAALRPRRVVADTANGMGGLVVPAVFDRLGVFELEVMYPELDGTFPNHPADPLQPANQRDLRARVVSGGFDVGLAFDGDADRVFVVDETGTGLSGSTTTAILSAVTLRTHPGATILYNLICSKAVPEVIREHGGVPMRTRVGHSFIKQRMAETGARLRRRALGALLLRRATTAPTPASIATVQMLAELSRVRRGALQGARALRALLAERRDQHARRRRRRRPRPA